MSLLGLPSDCLIEVFKNLDITSLEKMKKVHPKFKAIIIRYKLDWRKANKLSIFRFVERKRDGCRSIRWSLQASIYEEKFGRDFYKSISIEFEKRRSQRKTAQHIREIMKEMHLSSIESLHFADTGFHLDNNVIFEYSDIDLSHLVECSHTMPSVNLRFLDDILLNKIAHNKPRIIRFSHCYSSISVQGIIKLIENTFIGVSTFCWDLGFIGMSTQDYDLLEQFALINPHLLFEADFEKHSRAIINEGMEPIYHQHIEFKYY